MSYPSDNDSTRHPILAAGFPAERQFATVAKLHPLLRPVIAHALDIAEQPLQSLAR